MNLVKVFNSKGEHVDSFRKQQSAAYYRYSFGWGSFNSLVRRLNRTGFCIRRQLPDLAKAQLGAL